MSTTIVAAQHSFDELLGQMGRQGMIESTGTDGRQLRPSVDYFLEHAGDGCTEADMDAADAGSESATYLAALYYRERTEQWLIEHTTLLAQYDVVSGRAPSINDMTPEYKALFDEHYAYQEELHKELSIPRRKAVARMPDDPRNFSVILAPETVMWWWEKHGLLQWGGGSFLYVPHDGVDVPDWVIEQVAYWFVKPGPYPGREGRQTGKRHVAITRPIISPAFMHDGRKGLGRISSDQVTFGLYDALIAPKEEWAKTAKGWPIYRPDPTSNKLAIKVAPIVENRNNLDAQRDEMWQIVREFSIADFDVIAMMMAQVLEEARNDGRAILPADAMLDYRGVGQRIDKAGHSAGRHPKLRMALSESVYRIAHLKITTDGLPILEYNSKGGVISSPMDINEPVLQLHSNYSRQRDDKTMLWEYSLGRWFTTFREKPNAFTAYMLERALAYNPRTEQWTKQLAYYLAFDMRRNADNGQELAGPISRFMDGARIPCDPRYALKARDRFENSMRRVVKDGLIRIMQGDDIIDASSPAVDAWQPGGADALKGRNWLGAYRKLRISLRCNEDIEHRYDIEIRKKKASVTERKTKKEAASPTAKGRAK